MKMMKFKEFRQSLFEAATEGKPYKIGKYKAEIKKQGNKFVAFLDGEQFDKFKSVKEAERALKDFVDLLDKQK